MTDELVPPADPNDAIEQLRARIAELERERDDARAEARSAAERAGDVERVNAELAQLREQLAEARRPPAPRRPKYDGLFEVPE